MEKRFEPKKIFNTDSRELHEEAKIIGGDPDGIIDFKGTPHTWAKTIYDNMKARTWFVNQIKNVGKDATNYINLSDAQKRSYDLVLAQLITNDSIQSTQLVDNIDRWITSPVVSACLKVQSMEETLHSESYTSMADDIAQDRERIMYLARHDKELMRKNKAVENMYARCYNGENPTAKDLLVACGANQILEELVFPNGFAGILLLKDILPASAEFISEIMKDETLSHVPLFKNIFRTIVIENFDGVLPEDVEERIIQMVKDMADAERRWGKYALKGIMGASEKAIDLLVDEQANSVCKNLGIRKLFSEPKYNPLKELLKEHLRGDGLDTKGNIFEKNVVEYSKNTVIIDF